MILIHFLVDWISKDFCSSASRFCGHWSETSFQKSFIPVFQVWLFFWRPRPFYSKKERVYYQMHNLIQNWLELVWNQRNEKRKSLPALLFALCRFGLNLIKIRFFWNSKFFRSSKNFVSSQEEAEKARGFRQ